jgi:hypothetical protein
MEVMMNRFINKALLVLVLNASIGLACFGMPQGSVQILSSSIAASTSSQQREPSLSNELRLWLAGQQEFTSKFDQIQASAIMKIIAESADEFTLSKIRNFSEFNLNLQYLGFDEKTADALASRFCTLYRDVINPAQSVAVQPVAADTKAMASSAGATETNAGDKKESKEEARQALVRNALVSAANVISAPVGQGTVGSVAVVVAPAITLEKAQERVRNLETLQQENEKRYLDLVRQYEQKLEAAKREASHNIPDDVKVAVQKLVAEKQDLQALCQSLEAENNRFRGQSGDVSDEVRRLNTALREKEKLAQVAQEQIATLREVMEQSNLSLKNAEHNMSRACVARAYAEADAKKFGVENERLIAENKKLRGESFFDTCQKLQETLAAREREVNVAHEQASRLYAELYRMKTALDMAERNVQLLHEEKTLAVADKQKLAEENKRLAEANKALEAKLAAITSGEKMYDGKEVALQVAQAAEAAKKEAAAEAAQCPICMTNKVDRVFVCGHTVCHGCLAGMEKAPVSSRRDGGGLLQIKCPKCRTWSGHTRIRNLFS